MSSGIPLEQIVGTEGLERLAKAREALAELERLSQLLAEGETFWSFPGQSEEESRVEAAYAALNEFFAHQVFLAYHTGMTRVVVDLLLELPQVDPKIYQWLTEEMVYTPDDAEEQLTKMMRDTARGLLQPRTNS